MNANVENVKIALPKFLKLLTANDVPVKKAMSVASKIYNDYNTPEKLSLLSDVKLKAAGIDDKDDRRLVVNAIRRAGYAYRGKRLKANGEDSGGPVAGPSNLPAVEAMITPTKRKRKRAEEENEFLPDGPSDEAAKIGSLDFKEVLDEQVLRTKFTVVNRAPLMVAWATLVAERMSFTREEALSIASVYTELNAVSKGISLGLFNKEKEEGLEAQRSGSQPYVELMGRSPLYKSKDGQWCALSNGTPVSPGTAFSYISRSFRQTTPYIIGALRLLAESHTPQELNRNAWSLYAAFRPVVDGWGKRSEVRCDTILELRKKITKTTGGTTLTKPLVEFDNMSQLNSDEEPDRKKIAL